MFDFCDLADKYGIIRFKYRIENHVDWQLYITGSFYMDIIKMSKNSWRIEDEGVRFFLLMHICKA